jgi:hypothetical protein
MTALNRVRSAAAEARGPVPGASGRRLVRRGTVGIGTLAIGAAAVGTALVAALASPALAATAHPGHRHCGFGFGTGNDDAVFVQTDNTAGNAVVAYHRSSSGTLTDHPCERGCFAS